MLAYDPETGIFTWKARPARCIWVGDVAGCLEKNGYRRIDLFGKHYLAHRLAWLLSKGEWPNGDIDHEDRNKDNNRIGNLRPATVSQNAANRKRSATNTSGFKGVCWNSKSGKWQAQIKVGNRSRYLGLFDTAEAAHAKYLEAAKASFGEFARAA